MSYEVASTIGTGQGRFSEPVEEDFFKLNGRYPEPGELEAADASERVN